MAQEKVRPMVRFQAQIFVDQKKALGDLSKKYKRYEAIIIRKALDNFLELPKKKQKDIILA